MDSFDTKKGKKWRLVLIQIGQEMDLLYAKVDSFKLVLASYVWNAHHNKKIIKKQNIKCGVQQF